jgi:polyphosphate kinase 2 (PPK2 family)
MVSLDRAARRDVAARLPEDEGADLHTAMTASAMGSCGGVFDCSYLEEVVANRLDTEMPRAELEAKIERIAAFDRDLVAAGTTVVRRRSRKHDCSR